MSNEDFTAPIVEKVQAGNIGFIEFNPFKEMGAARTLFDELTNNDLFGSSSQRVTNAELRAVTKAFEQNGILPTFDRDQLEEVALHVQGTAGSHEAFVVEAIIPGANKGQGSRQELWVLGVDGKFREGSRFTNADGETYIGSLPGAQTFTKDELHEHLERSNQSPKIA